MEELPSELEDDEPLSEAEDFPSGDDPLRELERRRHEERVAVEEAGGGESEGFELAEEELIEHTSHGDGHAPSRIMRDAAAETEDDGQDYGEADEEIDPDG